MEARGAGVGHASEGQAVKEAILILNSATPTHAQVGQSILMQHYMCIDSRPLLSNLDQIWAVYHV